MMQSNWASSGWSSKPQLHFNFAMNLSQTNHIISLNVESPRTSTNGMAAKRNSVKHLIWAITANGANGLAL